MSKIYTLYILILFSLFLGSNLYAQEVVIKDGDSITIDKQRIRLIGIDAPEYNQECKDKNQKLYKCGQSSTNHLKSLTKDKNVTCEEIQKDIYNRALSICYASDINLNSQMVKDGYAITYLDSNYKQEEDYAKEHKKGIWQGIFMHPRLFRLLKEKQKNQ